MSHSPNNNLSTVLMTLTTTGVTEVSHPMLLNTSNITALKLTLPTLTLPKQNPASTEAKFRWVPAMKEATTSLKEMKLKPQKDSTMLGPFLFPSKLSPDSRTTFQEFTP